MTRRQTIRLALLASVLLAAGSLIVRLFWSPSDQSRSDAIAAALARHDLERARGELASWRRAGGRGPEVDLLEGTLALRAGRLDAALATFAALKPEPPYRERLLQLTGECLHRMGRLAEAKECLIPLVREFPGNPEGHRSLAALSYDLGANDDALLELDALKRLVPEDYRAYHLAARIYADFERYDEAIRNGREALRRAPPPGAAGEIRECLAASLNATQQPEQALEVLNDSAVNAASLVLAADALRALGRFDEARLKTDEALRLDPKGHAPRSLAARLALDEGKTEAAISLLDSLLKDYPHEYKDRYRLAMAYQTMGNTAESQRQLKQFEASQTLYCSLSDLNTQAILEPENAEVRRKLAEVCRMLGKEDLAGVWEQAARNVTPH